MTGWYGCSSGSGAEHEPSEDRGQAAWGAADGAGSPPPWASAETQVGGALPPTWTPPPYTPPPGPRHTGRRLLITLTLTAVLGAGAGAGFWYLTRGTTAGTGTTPATSVSVTAPAPQTSPAYRRAQDPLGYTLDVPADWTRRQKQGRLAPLVYYDSPGDGRQLQIFALAEKTPAQSLDLAENDPGYGFSRQPGYRVLDRRSGATWAELSYRYDDEDIGPRQVVDHRFRAADGTLYAIRSSGPAALAPELVRAPLTTVVTSFCPAGGPCS
ncbi:hypothetical protein [Streptomyces sp. HUAS ZL42]|uniref:hypothetical protein n=1 Tax=Streptomyces sp. HUAS ZL42 TaxID=3231715 RepID=UPI00345E11CD